MFLLRGEHVLWAIYLAKRSRIHKLESQTTKLSLALNSGRSSFCKVSLRAICSNKELKLEASALKPFYSGNLNLVNSSYQILFLRTRSLFGG